MTGRATILRGDARALPLPDASVDLVVTSPPYWALRSYQDGGGHYDGQVGAEQTPAAYVDALVECTREWMRVLKSSGSLWVNLGDKYSSPGGHTDNTASSRLQCRPNLRKQGRVDRSTATFGVPAKSLFGLPWRYAIRCIDELGLILRAEVIWSKPNGLPESVTDRVRRSHEQWFHFTMRPRYFSAVDAIREPASGYTRPPGSTRVTPAGARPRAMADTCNPLGKLPGSVWEVATEPLHVPDGLGVDHYAAFPMEWPRRIVAGWSPSGICTACGEGRRLISFAERTNGGRQVTGAAFGETRTRTADGARHQFATARTPTGEACACPDVAAPTRPAVVLDPFGGTGTTALVARALGRHGISVDRSGDYCRLAAWRTSDLGQLAKALGVPAPRRELDGQLDLLAMEATA